MENLSLTRSCVVDSITHKHTPPFHYESQAADTLMQLEPLCQHRKHSNASLWTPGAGGGGGGGGGGKERKF